MKIIARFFVVLIIITALVVSLAEAQGNKKAEDGDLGDWWVKNPLKYDPIPKEFLYHFDGAYTYSELGGNVDSKNHMGEATLSLRKHLLTSISSYDIRKSNTDILLSGASTSIESRNFHQKFRYGLTNWLEAVSGFLWVNDSAKYIKDRYVYYVGARFSIIDNPNLTLKSGGFYGYSGTEYMNNKIIDMKMYSTFTPVEGYDSNCLYFTQILKWKTSKSIIFTENATYMVFLKDPEYYNWMLKLALNFKLTRYTSFITSYIVKYDKNSFSKSLQDYLDNRRNQGLNTGDVETTDIIFAIGIQVSL